MKEVSPEGPSPAGSEPIAEGGEPAFQHAMHEPQRRVHVQEESRTIVVADDVQATPGTETQPTRKLEPYAATRTEQTVVIRDRRAIDELRRSGPKKGRSLPAILLWVAAGLAAFGLGGALAVMTAKKQPPEEPQAQTTAASTITPAAEPAPQVDTPVVAPVVQPALEPEPPAGKDDTPSLNAAELPVEEQGPKTQTQTPTRKPAPVRAPTAVQPKATAAPKAEIPSGI